MTTTQHQQPRSIQIPYDASKRQYRKACGTRLDKNGKPATQQFWLGNDPEEALRLYRELAGYWERVLKPAGQYWTAGHELRVRHVLRLQSQTAHAIQARLAAEAEARLKPLVDAGWLPPKKAAAAAADPTPVPPPPVNPATVPTLGTAARRFLDAAKARQVSGKYAKRCEQSLSLLYGQLPEATPLADLDAGRLTRVVGHFTSRPTSRVTGDPMAVATIRTLFETVRG